jgi:TolB-like protein/class 3 adenylate cyclase/Tfp pilus assembly protein PilF
MADEGFKRKLTAILSADAVEYSRLMGENEEATVQTLTAYREVLSTLIQQHNGKVVDSPGDNLLAEFVSVVDAVQCAVAVQKEIKSRNDELPENRKMQFRIGINLGDVIQEEDRIYGDGVNIAARLEGLAEPGGICISKTAFDHIESKLPYGYEFLGDQTVKNIAKPVSAYRVLMDSRVTFSGRPLEKKLAAKQRIPILIGAVALLAIVVAVGMWQFYMRRPKVEPASIKEMAFPLPDNPSIAIMPFVNMSGDPEQDYLADAISENIISSISMFDYLFVISRNSSFIYKGKAVKIKQVAEELGVQYILEGSIIKSGEQLRVTAQLIDALSGRHKWSQRYNTKKQDLFEVLDEITQSICTELGVALIWGEYIRPFYEGTNKFDAWEYVSKATILMEYLSRESVQKAKEFLKNAISIDPDYSYAWSLLGECHLNDAKFGWSDSRTESIKQGIELIDKALSLDDSNFHAHIAKGIYYQRQKQFEKALTKLEKAIALAPGDMFAHLWLSRNYCYMSRQGEAILHGKKALRLAPHGPWYIYQAIGWPYYFLGQYEESISWFKKCLERCERGECNLALPHYYLATAYSQNGQIEEAQFHMQKVLEYDPKFNLKNLRKRYPYKEADIKQIMSALRKVGAPEGPPSQ